MNGLKLDNKENGIFGIFGGYGLPVDSNNNCRYPREEWRPIPVEMMPAIEPVLVRPLRELDPVEDHHLHRRHHIESIRTDSRNKPSLAQLSKFLIFEFF